MFLKDEDLPFSPTPVRDLFSGEFPFMTSNDMYDLVPSKIASVVGCVYPAYVRTYTLYIHPYQILSDQCSTGDFVDWMHIDSVFSGRAKVFHQKCITTSDMFSLSLGVKGTEECALKWGRKRRMLLFVGKTRVLQFLPSLKISLNYGIPKNEWYLDMREIALQ